MIKKIFLSELAILYILFSNNISHASDIASEGRIIISNPDVLYTIYLGMPRDYVDINFQEQKVGINLFQTSLMPIILRVKLQLKLNKILQFNLMPIIM